MELVINQSLGSVKKPIDKADIFNQGILNSNYKAIVKENFSKSTTKSIFGIRQRIKSSQFNMVNHPGVILKLSVFAAVLIAIF